MFTFNLLEHGDSSFYKVQLFQHLAHLSLASAEPIYALELDISYCCSMLGTLDCILEILYRTLCDWRLGCGLNLGVISRVLFAALCLSQMCNIRVNRIPGMVSFRDEEPFFSCQRTL